jgi:hypothetical protein
MHLSQEDCSRKLLLWVSSLSQQKLDPVLCLKHLCCYVIDSDVDSYTVTGNLLRFIFSVKLEPESPYRISCWTHGSVYPSGWLPNVWLSLKDIPDKVYLTEPLKLWMIENLSKLSSMMNSVAPIIKLRLYANFVTLSLQALSIGVV